MALKDVVIEVTGKKYPLGDVAPGETRALKLEPTSESSVVIELTNRTGDRERLLVDVYFEPGYYGDLTVTIEGGKVGETVENISPFARTGCCSTD